MGLILIYSNIPPQSELPSQRSLPLDTKEKRYNTDVGKAKGAMSAGGTHRGDRKTRAIGDHDGRRMRGRRRVNGGEDARVGSGVVSGSRLGDPVWPDGRSRSHGAERVGQGRRAPTDRPGQYGRRWGPRRCGKRPWRSTSEHGRRRARSCMAGCLERPLGPRPRVVERCPGRRVPTNRSGPRRSTCEHRRRWVRLIVPTTTAMATTSAPPTLARLGGRRAKRRRRQRRSSPGSDAGCTEPRACVRLPPQPPLSPGGDERGSEGGGRCV